MILIVDTNIIFAGLLRNSTTRTLLIDPPFILYAPETAIKEIRKYEEQIIQRSGLTKIEFETLLNLITDSITIIEKEKYQQHIKEAAKHIGDPGDIPFLALALSMPNNGIWTENVKHYKKANIKIWTTKEIMNKLQ